MLAISKFHQNFAKFGNFAKTFKISSGPSKFCHFLHFGKNFASLATLVQQIFSELFFSLLLSSAVSSRSVCARVGFSSDTAADE